MGSLPDLRVVQIRAGADLGDAFLEIRGEVVMRGARRLSDLANHPDPLLELDRAAMRIHRAPGAGRDEAAGAAEWEQVAGLTVNRDHVAVLVPVAEQDPGPDPRLVRPPRVVRVKLVCRAVVVTGFIRVPLEATIASFLHETRARFIAVTDARVLGSPGGADLGELEGAHPFCLVNRGHVAACAEAMPTAIL